MNGPYPTNQGHPVHPYKRCGLVTVEINILAHVQPTDVTISTGREAFESLMGFRQSM